MDSSTEEIFAATKIIRMLYGREIAINFFEDNLNDETLEKLQKYKKSVNIGTPRDTK